MTTSQKTASSGGNYGAYTAVPSDNQSAAQAAADQCSTPNDVEGTMAAVTNDTDLPTPPDPMLQPLWEIDDRLLDPFAELPPTMTWGRMGDRPAIERQGIITISAKPKQGKSLSVYAILSSVISGEPIDTFTPDAEQRPRLVMVFDTEMNKPTLQRRMRGICKTLGSQRNRFVVVPLLAVPKSERIELIEDITDRYKPDIVAMDVVTKLVNDFNSSDENSAFGDWIEKYAEERTVIVVIHQNKSKEDSSMKGHMGSILGEAAVENYSASMKDSIFTLSPINARNTCAEGAPGISFILTDEGTFIGAAQALDQRREDRASEWRKDLTPIFGDDETLKHNELQDRIAKVQNLSDASARRKIKEASECGAIVKVSDDKKAPYRLT